MTIFFQNTIRYQILCSLANMYCDLRLSNKVHKFLIQNIEKERKKNSKTKLFRRLLITLIDINIQRYHYDNAINIIAKFENIFNHLSNLNVNDQLLYMRTFVIFARFCYYKSKFHKTFQR